MCWLVLRLLAMVVFLWFLSSAQAVFLQADFWRFFLLETLQMMTSRRQAELQATLQSRRRSLRQRKRLQRLASQASLAGSRGADSVQGGGSLRRVIAAGTEAFRGTDGWNEASARAVDDKDQLEKDVFGLVSSLIYPMLSLGVSQTTLQRVIRSAAVRFQLPSERLSVRSVRCCSPPSKLAL